MLHPTDGGSFGSLDRRDVGGNGVLTTAPPVSRTACRRRGGAPRRAHRSKPAGNKALLPFSARIDVHRVVGDSPA